MRIAPALAVAAMMAFSAPAPATAHETDGPAEDLSRALKDFFDQMQPAFDEALEMLQQFQGIDDPRNYLMPEILPNGDIIIRRREDAPPYQEAPEETPDIPAPEEGTVDL